MLTLYTIQTHKAGIWLCWDGLAMHVPHAALLTVIPSKYTYKRVMGTTSVEYDNQLAHVKFRTSIHPCS